MQQFFFIPRFQKNDHYHQTMFLGRQGVGSSNYPIKFVNEWIIGKSIYRLECSSKCLDHSLHCQIMDYRLDLECSSLCLDHMSHCLGFKCSSPCIDYRLDSCPHDLVFLTMSKPRVRLSPNRMFFIVSGSWVTLCQIRMFHTMCEL